MYEIKKNILIVTSSNFPFGSASANVLRLFSIGLAKAGNNVEVILQRGKQFGEIRNKDFRVNKIENVIYRYCGFIQRPSNKLLKIIDSLIGTLLPVFFIIFKKIRNKIDVVIIYSNKGLEILPIILVSKVLKIPVINFVVEWYEKETIVTEWWRIVNWWDFLFIMKIVNKFANGLIVTSNFLKNYYLQHSFKDEDILILPNLVDMSIFNNQPKLVKKTDKVRIGYCGTPTRKDGIDDLLVAFKIVNEKNKNTILLVIGDNFGPNSLLPNIKEKCRSLGIENSVEFTGLVDWMHIPELLNSCEILVLARPSGKFAEAGFPTKLGEYMACKKPVVVTSVGDIPIYLKHRYNAMLAKPDAPESVAENILELIENPKLAEKVGVNGYLWANEKLNYLNAIKDVEKYLDKFIIHKD